VTNAPAAAERLGYVFTGWDKSLDKVMADFATKAQYTLVRYPITYLNLKGETHTNPSEYDITMAGKLLLSPSCGNPNLKWLGWSPTNCIPRDSAGPLTYSGTWAYRLTFSEDENRRVTLAGGSDACFVAEGTGVTNTPSVEVQAGYSFAGWKNAKGEIIPAGLVSNVTESATYTAVATANVYRIVYEGLEGAKNNVKNPAIYTIEDAVVFLPPTAETAERGVFVGWTPAGIAAGTTGEVTVVASWREASTYKVEVKAKGGGSVSLYDAADKEVANPGRYVEGTHLSAEATVSNGWAFAGWEKDGSSLTSGETPLPLYVFVVSNDVSLTAVFTQRVYTVTIDGKPTGVRYGETATYSTAANVTNGAVNVVCTGWTGTGDVPATGTSNSVSFVVTQASSLTWQYATNYWVSVKAKDKGEAASSPLVKDATSTSCEGGSVALYDAAEKVAANPAWYPAGTNLVAEATAAEGWLFAGWYSGEATSSSLQKEEYAFTVTTPVTLTAVFTQNVYTVTFELDENLKRTGGGALVQVVAHGEAATLPTVEGIGYHALEGWQLVDAASCRVRVDDEGFLIDAAGRRVYEGEVPGVTEDLCFVARSVEAVPYIAADVAAEYEPKESIQPIVVRCVHEEGATLKVTGLPSGLYFTTKEKTYTAKVGGVSVKLTAPANSIYGTPSKSGLWTSPATASVSVKSGRKTVTTVVATTNFAFVIRSGGETVVRTEVALADVADSFRSDEDVASPLPGKTTGQGVYAAGRKVTLKATANKGYVFSGWWRGEAERSSLLSGEDAASPLGSAPVSRLASLAIVVPRDDTVYEARFITKEDDAKSIRAGVNGMALFSESETTLAGTPSPLDVATNVSVGVYLEWPVAYGADSAATVAVSGLPSGLKFTAKPVTTRVTTKIGGKNVTTVVTNVPANTIYGTPTAASKTDRWGDVVPSQVKVTVTTAGKAKAIGIVKLTVEALPEALIGTYVGGSTGGTDADVASSLTSGGDAASPLGSATVTLAKTGKVSGKWISAGKTWTLTAGYLDCRGADDTSVATVTAKCSKEVETLTLVFAVNDLGYGTVVAFDEDKQELFSATYVPWKADAELKALAKDLKGKKFTVASDDGVKLAGTVGANGTVSVKGTFDIGATSPYTATVSSTLVPVDDGLENLELFVYYAPKASKGFEGCAKTLRLRWNGSEFDIIK